MRRRIGQKSKQKLNKMLMNLGNGFKKVIKSQRVNGRLPLVDSGGQERSGQMFTIEIIFKIFQFFRAGFLLEHCESVKLVLPPCVSLRLCSH